MASFDENGKYIKTDWKAGDKITSTKLNKIEESIEAVNDNDISRHVEADARLDALEAKDVAHDKELTKIKNDIADNKAAAELGDYDINSRMTFLENELNEGIEEVYNVASTVDGKIATAKNDMRTQVSTAQANMTAQVNSAMNVMNAAQAEMTSQVNTAKDEITAQVNDAKSEINTRVYDAKTSMATQVATARNDMTAQVDAAQANMTAQVNAAQASMTDQVIKGKADMEAMIVVVDGKIAEAEANMTTQVNNAKSEMNAIVDEFEHYLNIDYDSFLSFDPHELIIGYINDANDIVLSYDLSPGLYEARYEYEDGTQTKITTFSITGEPEIDEPEIDEPANLMKTGELYLNQRYSSSGGGLVSDDKSIGMFALIFPFEGNVEQYTLSFENMKVSLIAETKTTMFLLNADKANPVAVNGGNTFEDMTSGITTGTAADGTKYGTVTFTPTNTSRKYIVVSLSVKSVNITSDDIADYVIKFI